MADRPLTMPAAVYHGPHRVVVDDVPVPDPGPGDVLVEVAWCGVCGSDLHVFLEGWGRPGAIGGHEWSGRVSAVGEGVEGLAEGDAVVGGPSPRCGLCEPCRSGRPSLCVERPLPGVEHYQGAFARYVRTEAAAAVPVPPGLDLRVAALAEPLAVALHALTRSGVEPGQRAFVSGAGPIGALVVVALRALGIDDVLVSEPNAARRALAERLGATEVVEPDQLPVPSGVEPTRLPDEPADVAFECSGKAVAMESALDQLGKGGTLVLVGAGIEPPRFDPNRILLNELVVTGAFEYDAHGVPAALDLLASGRLPLDQIVEPEDVPLSGLLDACEGLGRGDIAGKVMIVPKKE